MTIPTTLRSRSHTFEAMQLEPGTDNYKDICDWLAPMDETEDVGHDGEGTVSYRSQGLAFVATPGSWVVRVPAFRAGRGDFALVQVLDPADVERDFEVVDEVGTLQRIWDEDLAISRIIKLPDQLATDPIHDDIVEWFTDQDAYMADLLGVGEAFVQEHGWAVVLDEEGSRLNGWLLEVWRPELKPWADGKSASFTGSGIGHVVWGDTYDEALAAALTWAEAEGQRMWPQTDTDTDTTETTP